MEECILKVVVIRDPNILMHELMLLELAKATI